MFILFSRDKKRLSLAVTRSTATLVRFHLGTVAFGALVIGLVRLIRAIFAFIQKRLKGVDNDCARGILWCCHCCLWCFECALKFLTRNAYIETGTYDGKEPGKTDINVIVKYRFKQKCSNSLQCLEYPVKFLCKNLTSQSNISKNVYYFCTCQFLRSYLRMQLLYGRKKGFPSALEQHSSGRSDQQRRRLCSLLGQGPGRCANRCLRNLHDTGMIPEFLIFVLSTVTSAGFIGNALFL